MAIIRVKSAYLLRRDTAENWQTKNPVLRQGEEGFETDTRKRKVGDGTTEWNSLDYDISSIDVDSELSATSQNPVENKAIYSALSGYATKEYVDNAIGDIETVLATMFNDVPVVQETEVSE